VTDQVKAEDTKLAVENQRERYAVVYLKGGGGTWSRLKKTKKKKTAPGEEGPKVLINPIVKAKGGRGRGEVHILQESRVKRNCSGAEWGCRFPQFKEVKKGSELFCE